MLLDRIEIKDAVITAGALHAQREHACYLARRERRTLTVTPAARGAAFPHAAQAIQIMRRRKY